ncbi:hypothetical protein A2U01_0059610, partial [Trifolium medium]|nr:hypothetical protein [Trifolium medium]
MPAIRASYSAWLLLALKAKCNDCSTKTPSGPSRTTPAPLPPSDWMIYRRTVSMVAHLLPPVAMITQ